jgi:SAM-dependent methyltransferase
LRNPLNDPVAELYTRWRYPEPILDLPSWLKNNWQWFDPSHARRLFWPDRTHTGGLEILVAGCGTSQGAVIACTNPDAHVVAIDVSVPALEHHRFLKEKYGLSNLDFHHLPIEELDALHQDFDLVICTGVLHHLASPGESLQALARRLRTDGVAAIMLYARYGRAGVEILQSLFRDLGLRQDEASVQVVKDTLAALQERHPVRDYLKMAPDLRSDAGLVDTFLHGRDRSYTVDDCLELVSSAGLVFQDWFFKAPYSTLSAGNDALQRAIEALPQTKQWSAMERINTRNACHFFMACHPDRLPRTYRIDFSTKASLDAVPSFRFRCGLDGSTLFKPGWRTTIEQPSLSLMLHVDGHRTIREIVARARSADPTAGDAPQPRLEDIARKAFRSLWEGDFLAIEIDQQG